MNLQFEGANILVEDADRRVRVGTNNWIEESVSVGPASPDDTYRRICGTTRQLTFDPVNIMVMNSAGNHIDQFQVSSERREYDSPMKLRVDASITIRVWADTVDDSSKIVLSEESGRVTVETDSRLAVRVGFRNPEPTPTIRVPKSLYGLCTALSHVHRPTTDRSPIRATPNGRNPPARVRWGETIKIPSEIEYDLKPNIQFDLPWDKEKVATVAPLVYYLGANIAAVPGADQITLRAGSRVYTIGQAAKYQPREILKLVFYLDLLVAHSNASVIREQHIIDELGLEPEALSRVPMHRRLQRYLALEESPAEILQRFPEWHLSLSVEPTLENIQSTLPLFRHLPLIEIAESQDKVQDQSESDGTPRTHGRVAPGVPETGFKLPSGVVPPVSQTNQEDTQDDDPSFQITVVSNEMIDQDFTTESETSKEESHGEGFEGPRVTEQYERIESTWQEAHDIVYKEAVSTQELREIFAADNDLVHFAGHCDEDAGLRCVDGDLRGEEIGTVRTTTFMLSACESSEHGKALIENGAAGGVVTEKEALHPRTKEIGQSWARLVVSGWPITTALEVANQMFPGKADNHFIVGDGTTVLVESDAALPPRVEVNTVGGRDEYEVSVVYDQPIFPGVVMKGDVDKVKRISGSGVRYRAPANKLRDLVENLQSPLRVDGEFYWPENRSWL